MGPDAAAVGGDDDDDDDVAMTISTPGVRGRLMARPETAPSRTSAQLDNLDPSCSEGWREFVTAAPHATRTAHAAGAGYLMAQARDDYETRWRKMVRQHRADQTPELAAVQTTQWTSSTANDQDGDKTKARGGHRRLSRSWQDHRRSTSPKFHLCDIRANGEFTDSGDERWPVRGSGWPGIPAWSHVQQKPCWPSTPTRQGQRQHRRLRLPRFGLRSVATPNC